MICKFACHLAFSPDVLRVLKAGTKVWNWCLSQTNLLHDREGRWPTRQEIEEWALACSAVRFKTFHPQCALEMAKEFARALGSHLAQPNPGPPPVRPKRSLSTVVWRKEALEPAAGGVRLFVSEDRQKFIDLPLPGSFGHPFTRQGKFYQGKLITVKVIPSGQGKKPTGFRIEALYNYRIENEGMRKKSR